MNYDDFWLLIEQCKHCSGDEQKICVYKKLECLSSNDIVAFQNYFVDYLNQSYHWDLWAVPFLVYGSCSDDVFENFRAWLIYQGKTVFESSLRDSEFLTKHLLDLNRPTDALNSEQLLYIADNAYLEKTGSELHSNGLIFFQNPAGLRWTESDVQIRYPQLVDAIQNYRRA